MRAAIWRSLTTTSVAGQFVHGFGDVLPYPAPLDIAAGDSPVSFQYADTAAGTPTLTATATSFAPVSQQETVVAAAGQPVRFHHAGASPHGSAPSQTMTVELDDAFGNPVYAANAH